MKKHVLYTLAKSYPGLYLPIKEGISKTEEYKDLCLRGKESPFVLDFSFDENDSYELIKTPAGEVRTLLLFKREDFLKAIQKIAYKGEPTHIEDSTGAMTIFGLNNWEKVRNNSEDYKDSLIILSSGNYSNVSNKDVKRVTNNEIDLDEENWIKKSIEIRKYHELTHFVMRKIYPDNIDFIRDEILADLAGLYYAFGRADSELAKLFLGLEGKKYREGGRYQNYEGADLKKIPLVIKMIDEYSNIINKQNYKNINDLWLDIERYIKK